MDVGTIRTHLGPAMILRPNILVRTPGRSVAGIDRFAVSSVAPASPRISGEDVPMARPGGK